MQALTESDPHTKVLSIDGISAFDMISRKAMLEVLQQLPGGEQVLPFVRLFYGRQSTYLWDDDLGVVHQIPQVEGGEQGDPLMPLVRVGDPCSVAGGPVESPSRDSDGFSG